MKKVVATLLALSLAASVMAGCTQAPATQKPASGTAAKSGTQSKAAGTYAGTAGKDSITFNLGSEPPDLNSITSTDTVSHNVLRATNEGLVRLDQKDNVVPGMAEKWEYDEKTLTYTFHLRDAKWDNGDPVTAKDFLFAWSKLLDPATASDYAYFGYIIKNGEKIYKDLTDKKTVDWTSLGIRAVDDKTFTVTLEQPTAYALAMFAYEVFLPVNEKFFTAAGDKYAGDADKLLSNGPYKLTKWAHEDSIELTKNQSYYDAASIAIPKLIGKMIKDSNTSMNEFKSGNIDMIGLTGDQAAALKGEGVATKTWDTGASWYFLYNTKDKNLSSAKIRQAMTMGVDVDSFIKNIRKNASVAATSFTPPSIGVAQIQNSVFSTMVGKQLTHDFTEAKKLLDEGLKEINLTLDTFKPVMLCDDTDNAQKYAAYYQEQWKKNLGISVEVKPMPFKSRLEAMSQHNFSVVLAGWGPDYNDPNTFLDMWVTGAGNNHSQYSSASYDKYIKDAAAEKDPAKRGEMLKQAELLLLKDQPIGPLWWEARDYVTSSKLQGMYRSSFQDMNFRWAKIA